MILRIGDSLIELFKETVVGISIRGIDFNKVSTRYVTYTNALKAPKTSRNLATLGRIDIENTSETKQYQELKCTITDDGFELMEEPYLKILRVSDSIEFALFESEIDLFSKIKNKRLYDIAPIPSSAWNNSDIDTARLSTSGIVSAVLDWGNPTGTSIYRQNFFLPCIYYHTIVKKILESTGLTLSGSILTDTKFTDLLVPFPGDEFLYPEKFVEPISGRAFTAASTTYNLITTGVDCFGILDTVNFGSNFDLSTKYTFDKYCNASITAISSVFDVVFNDGTFVNCQLVKNGVTVLDSGLVTTPSATITNTYTGNFSPGDYIEIIHTTNAPTIGTSFKVGCQMEVTGNRDVNRDFVYWNEILWGSYTCDDFINDFFSRFFVEFKQENGILYLKTVNEKLSNLQDFNNWDGKSSETVEIDFTSDFAKQNIFKYKDSNGFGDGIISIPLETLEKEKTLFESSFSASDTGYIRGVIASTVPVYDSTSASISDFKNEPGLRLLTLRDRTFEPSITFNVTSRSDYKIAFFETEITTKSASFQYYVDSYYAIVKDIVSQTKKVVKDIWLTPLDISKYDKLKVIYLDKNYYLLISIKNFVKGKKTRVELFKI